MERLDKPEALRRLELHLQSVPRGECPLCALVRVGTVGALVLARDEHGAVLLNRFAQRPGHLMVIATPHVEHVHELPWPAYSGLQRLAYDAGLALQRVLSPARIYTAVLGSASPALTVSYAHLHVHVVPVAETDERARPARVFSWSEGIYVYDDAEAEALGRELRAAWPGTPGAPR